MAKKGDCKYCREGHTPTQTKSGKWEHWLVKSVFPARIHIVACKAPPETKSEAAITATAP